ncbi:Indoleamine 2,3-dioxygenase [Aspergillus karnatakaensis]|uniref:indoleamine 2,3-dioxygenase n=1 Tax=Aspergillus karnatakaensis TaxID=1810916 RepID=UPI003CCC9FEF
MLLSPEFSLEEYEVSLQNGFLPDAPLQTLQDPYYAPWEAVVKDLTVNVKAQTLRAAVDALPVLGTSKLLTEADWRRAYVILAYLTHGYVWGGERPRDILPPAISVPFLEVSKHLELPPCATYAALNLWNYSTTSPNGDLTCPDNLHVTLSLTGTKDEEWFFMISVAIEARGGRIIQLMLDTIHAVSVDDQQRVAAYLHQISDGFQEVARLLERMYEKCRPAVFFHQLRPYLAGSKNMASAGLPSGLFYDLGEGKGEWRQYSGGSNAQSSLIQTFDIFLGVEHSATGSPTKAEISRAQPLAKNPYIQEMRNYMPGPHRRFLEMLTRNSNVRTYALSHKMDSPVRDAYNAAVMSLGSFRDKHIQIVTRYIIMAAKMPPPEDAPAQLNLATSTYTQMKGSDEKISEGLSGTGGTDLIPFLKATRDTTKAAASYAD